MADPAFRVSQSDDPRLSAPLRDVARQVPQTRFEGGVESAGSFWRTYRGRLLSGAIVALSAGIAYYLLSRSTEDLDSIS